MHPIDHHLIDTNDIQLHVAVQGDGPLVIFCHGFPGHWSNWLNPMAAAAEAGFKAVAVDMRGYGQSTRPDAIEDYSMDHQVADMLGLLDFFAVEKAIFVGQDFGAPLVWNMALREPSRVAGVIGISVPFDHDYYGRGCWGHIPRNELPEQALTRLTASPINPPSQGFKAIAAHQFLHAHYFQKTGLADQELAQQPREFLTRLYWGLGSKGQLGDWQAFPSEGTAYLDVLPKAPDLPWEWMSEQAMDRIVEAYQRAGDKAFTGGLASYRVADINWAIGAQYAGLMITVPALFIAGEQDPVMATVDDALLTRMSQRFTDLRGIHLVEDAGHFVQLEQAERVSALIVGFWGSI